VIIVPAAQAESSPELVAAAATVPEVPTVAARADQGFAEVAAHHTWHLPEHPSTAADVFTQVDRLHEESASAGLIEPAAAAPYNETHLESQSPSAAPSLDDTHVGLHDTHTALQIDSPLDDAPKDGAPEAMSSPAMGSLPDVFVPPPPPWLTNPVAPPHDDSSRFMPGMFGVPHSASPLSSTNWPKLFTPPPPNTGFLVRVDGQATDDEFNDADAEVMETEEAIGEHPASSRGLVVTLLVLTALATAGLAYWKLEFVSQWLHDLWPA
jgi:hypothetical protein